VQSRPPALFVLALGQIVLLERLPRPIYVGAGLSLFPLSVLQQFQDIQDILGGVPSFSIGIQAQNFFHFLCAHPDQRIPGLWSLPPVCPHPWLLLSLGICRAVLVWGHLALIFFKIFF